MKSDFIVVGSGPGGATVARELARQGQSVLVLEQGSDAPLRGSLAQMMSIAARPGRGLFLNRDASLLLQGATLGGSSAINFATAMPPPLALFARHGVDDLQASLDEVRREVPMAPLPDGLIGPLAQRIGEGARSLGLAWQKLDKMIVAERCRSGCWRCAYGCPFGAKWTARNYLEDAQAAGAQLLSSARVTRVLARDGQACGVEFLQHGELRQALASRVILAGGGIASPRLLQASGVVSAEPRHFSDPVVAVMGSVADLDGGAEVPMAAGLHLADAGIMLADMTLPQPMYAAFAAQVGRFDRLLAHRRTLTLMVKVRDEIGGRIGPRSVNKSLQASDRAKLAQGVDLAKKILTQAGAKNIFKTWHFAAHPGGSVRIGEGVDANLQSRLKHLYVCDASVIPEPWGLPPTVTLLCLGKRLARHLGSLG
ncbi:GMC family oxidoreductase [Paucibacter sp. AS339]|uniref:GMC family oxidoreductase n=1 Tax=Paucibacter hankyongi TaxID=3133434 RepID=UPI0030B5A268